MRRFLTILAVVVASLVAWPVSAISDEKKEAVVGHCETIKNSLENTQKADARARV